MSSEKIILPTEVNNNVRFLAKKNVWHVLSKNKKVISCREAAAHRSRLGNEGIPLFDELKSELGYFVNKDHKKQKILVHCRGNQKLDRLKISSILNSEYQRITDTKEVKGLINPFSRQFRGLLQIFDRSTIMDFYPPYTMITNAGDFEYALEFEVKPLVNSLRTTLVEDIIRTDNYIEYKRHKIGILTGNGPDSGMLLWEKINSCIKTELEGRLKHSFRGDLSYPEIVIHSIPDMGISMELDKRLKKTLDIVEKSVLDLCNSGVTLMCIACNTTQYFKDSIERICNLYGVKYISIPEVIVQFLEKKQIKEFDLLGISHAVDLDGLSAYKELGKKFNVSVPIGDVSGKIDSIAYEIKKKEIVQARNHLNNLIKNYTQHKTIIVVLTEISTLLSKEKIYIKDKEIIDSLQLLADSISLEYVDGIFETLYVDKDRDYIRIDLLTNKEIIMAKKELWNILCEINYEFVPPLSSRSSTTAVFDLNSETATIDLEEPREYFEALIKQKIITSRKKSNGMITGFMSFIPNYKLHIESLDIRCHYITTIGVTKGERGHGITSQFYKMIEKVAREQKAKTVATRTWNSNKTHIQILLDLGYKTHVIKDDRGPGIDTLYLIKHLIDNED